MCRLQLHKAALLCLFLVPLCAAKDWKYEETHQASQAFSAGGSVHVRLGVGDLHIKRGDTDKIRMEYTVKSSHERNVKEARVDFDVQGNNATIEFHVASMGSTEIDVELEVPQNTNVDAHEKVGDLTVENLDGDKDLELGVGDIRIATGPSSYRLVSANTGIGDVHGDGYGETSGWLGKSLKYHGEGKYELRAHVGVGDIHLDGK
jgi:hypothetical protein